MRAGVSIRLDWELLEMSLGNQVRELRHSLGELELVSVSETEQHVLFREEFAPQAEWWRVQELWCLTRSFNSEIVVEVEPGRFVGVFEAFVEGLLLMAGVVAEGKRILEESRGVRDQVVATVENIRTLEASGQIRLPKKHPAKPKPGGGVH